MNNLFCREIKIIHTPFFLSEECTSTVYKCRPYKCDMYEYVQQQYKKKGLNTYIIYNNPFFLI